MHTESLRGLLPLKRGFTPAQVHKARVGVFFPGDCYGVHTAIGRRSDAAINGPTASVSPMQMLAIHTGETMTQEPKKPVANLYPPVYRDSLLWAASHHDIKSIDDITDQLVRIGKARPRGELHHKPAPVVPVFSHLVG